MTTDRRMAWLRLRHEVRMLIAERRAIVAARLGGSDWPGRSLHVVAVDAHTGEGRSFSAADEVDFIDAIAASCAVPGAWPAIAAFSVFSVVAHWNDLYWPLIVITDNALATPPLGMMLFADAETGSNYGALMAAAAMLTAPLVLVFLLARRRFIAGVTMTGLK